VEEEQMSCYRFFLLVFSLAWCSALLGSAFLVGPVPDRLEHAVVNCIQLARERIWVALYQLTSAPCVHALVAAKRRGVDVQVVLDKGMLVLPVFSFVRKQCGAAGIPLFWLGGQPLMHNKWALIDNQVWVGSANWTRAGLNKNHESCVLLSNNSIAQAFATHFVVLRRRSAGLSAEAPCCSSATVFFIPDNREALVAQLKAALIAANSSIMVALYSLTSRWFIQELVNAAGRATVVHVILEPSTIINQELVRKLRAAGVSVKKYRTAAAGGILHDKTIIVDNRLWLGSMNVTGAGMKYNHESMVVIEDVALVNKARNSFTTLWCRL